MYKLLVVDDEKMIRMGIKHGIDWASIGITEVFTAASAREALEIIEKERPQIMLTDISMTEMTGLDLIEKLQENEEYTQIRILVLTGYDSFDYARECIRMKVQNFLLKPIDEDELKKSIEEQIMELEEIRIQKELSEKQMRTEGARRQAVLEQFMRDLVHRRIEVKSTADYPQEYLVERNKSSKVVILIPDMHISEKQETEEHFKQMTIKNICMDMIDARQAGITFSDDDGRLTLVFFTSDTEMNVVEKVEELSEILKSECDIKLKTVLGSEVESLDSLFVSYNDAVYLLEQERKSFREIIYNAKERDRVQIIQEIYQEFKQAMVANIANGERVMDIFEKYQQAVHSYNLSKLQVQRWCVELAVNIYLACVMECREEADGRIENFIKTLLNAEREEILEITSMFIQKLVFKENEEHHEIISKAKRYIAEHLDEDLSVASLAEMFFLSPNYFSRLFKKEMHEGCNEYIVKKRIEKSRLLLETTTLKTGKIAMMVGYTDTNYFSLAFKKHTGMSPTKYREEVQKG